MNYAAMLDDLRRWNSSFGGGIPSQRDIEAAMRGEVDEETRQLMASYTHNLDRETITFAAASIDPDEWTLKEFEKAVADFIASVPDDKRAAAKVELKGGYEEITELVVSYDRPQTDEEWALSIAHALMHARKCQADDLANYERLFRKFQPST